MSVLVRLAILLAGLQGWLDFVLVDGCETGKLVCEAIHGVQDSRVDVWL